MIDLFNTVREFPQILQGIGVLGFFLYIGAFFAVQSGRLCGNSIGFSYLQVAAASFVLISLSSAFNLASFLTQVSFICIGIYGVSLRRNRIAPKQFNPSDFEMRPKISMKSIA